MQTQCPLNRDSSCGNFVPAGTTGNSPAFQRRVAIKNSISPGGTTGFFTTNHSVVEHGALRRAVPRAAAQFADLP